VIKPATDVKLALPFQRSIVNALSTIVNARSTNAAPPGRSASQLSASSAERQRARTWPGGRRCPADRRHASRPLALRDPRG